jgi:hypothetical protein
VSNATIDNLKRTLQDAGLEIYRIEGDVIRVAERVRMHLMDSGVALTVGSAPRVSLTIRSQRSDFPSASADELFDRVRATFGGVIAERGYTEVSAKTRNVTNPVDDSQLLDVWHEVTFERQVDDASELVDDVRWALGVAKCVDP